jgi:hypothetical protein
MHGRLVGRAVTGLSLTPGACYHSMGYMYHTGDWLSLHSRGVSLDGLHVPYWLSLHSQGVWCHSLLYVGHTARHQVNRVLTAHTT